MLIDFCFAGDDNHKFRSLSSNPIGLTTLKEHLFWVNENSKRLYWADKKSENNLNKKITLGKSQNLIAYNFAKNFTLSKN